MADSAAQALKDLNASLEKADKNLISMTQTLSGFFNQIKQAGGDVKAIFDYISQKAGKNGATQAEKIKILAEFVDANGKPLTESTVKERIKKLTSAVDSRESKVKIGTEFVDSTKMRDVINQYREYLRLLKMTPVQWQNTVMNPINMALGTNTSSGTKLGNARADEMTKVQRTVSLVNKELERQRDIEQTIANIQQRGGKSAIFEGQRQNVEQLNRLLADSKNKVESYKRTLAGLGTRGRSALNVIGGGDGSKNAIKEQMSLMRELYNLTRQYRQMQENQRKGKLVNPQDLEDTKRRLREILAEMKKIESENQGSRKTAAARLETERLRDRWREVNRESKSVGSNLSSLLPTLQRLASAFGIAFSVQGLVQFGKKLVETRGEFELQQTAMRSILQNKQLADEIWDKTMQQALQSPFTAMQLTKYTKQLAAYRIETDKLFDTTKMLADVSAGLGVDMQRLILAYGQVKASNFLRSSEIRQFTEAGVNILGELSTYLSETRGKFISTAQIMDMVQKRMVKFEDVEAIFKRMTDEGGIFYDMQYTQSQTVKGQIAKLHDAYDQMLNSIGKANQGTIRTFVGLLNDIVKNWREWKTVLDSVAIPALIISLKRFTQGLFAANAATIATDKSFKLLTRTGAKLNVRLKELFTTLTANPWMALAAVIGTATIAIWNHFKAVKAINDKYDELMLRSYETQKSMNGYIETIERNVDVMKNHTKSTEKYTEANKENEGIITRLKNDYPELLEGMDEQNIQYDQLIGRIKLYNDELEDRIRLEYMARASFGSDDLQTNISQLQEDYRQREMDFLENRARAEKKYLQLKAQGREADEDFWERQIRLSHDYKEQIEIIKRQNEAIRGGGGFSLQIRGYKSPGSAIFKSIGGRENDLRQNLERESLIYNDIIRELLQTINNDLGDDIEKFISDNQNQVDKLFKDKEGAGWKLLNDRIVKFFTAKGAEDNETRSFIEKQLNQMLLVPIKLDWNKSTSVSNNVNTNGDGTNSKNYKSISSLISLLKEMNSEYDKLSKSAYGFAKSNEKVRDSFKDAFDEIFKFAGININQVDTTSKASTANAMELVLNTLDKQKLWGKFGKDGGEKARQEFLKAFGQMKAEVDIQIAEQSRADFGRQIEEMFSDYDLTLNLDSMGVPKDLAKKLFGIDTSSLDEISAYMDRFVLEHTADWNEDINKVYQDALKKISDKEQEQYKNNVSNLFKRVKSTAEEMKIVVDQAFADINFAQRLFDPEYVDDATKTIKDKILENQRKIQELTPSEGGASGVALQEIKRLESENKILEYRVKRLQQMYGNIDATQYSALVRSTVEWENDNIRKISTEKLKEMPEYLDAMGRVAGRTNVELEEMLKYLEKLIAEGGTDVEINEYKSIISQIQKINQEIESNNSPFGKKGFAQVAKMIEDNLKYEEEMKNLEEERTDLITEENLLLDEQKKIEKELQTLKAQGNLSPEDQQRFNELQEDLKENYKEQTENTNKQKKNFAQIQTVNANNAKTMAIIDAIIHGVNDSVQQIYGNVKQIFTLLEDYGYDTEHGGISMWSKGLETFAQASQDATDGWDAFKQGDIVGVVYNVIKGITDIWHGINQMTEQNANDTIYEQEQHIEDLRRAYERLEKQIEKTWTTTDYMDTYNKMVQNLKEQIASLESQRNAEESKKNTDKDKVQEYNDAIQDLKDNIEDVKQKQIEIFGGIGKPNYRSAAEEFVGAWKEAFLETGDGLKGLQDHFDDFLNEWFVKQATMRIASGMLEPVFDEINKAVGEDSPGGANVLFNEIQNVRELFDSIAPNLSEALEALFGEWGLNGEGGLSGLAAGIQGMTEEQANILEAYWNSVRMYTANIDSNVARIADILGAGGVNTNPQLQQLQLIEQNTKSIQMILQSTVKSGHSQGGMGIKVFVN